MHKRGISDEQMSFPDVDTIPVKGVVIDIDNTLYEYEPVHQKAGQSCYVFWKHFLPLACNGCVLKVYLSDIKAQPKLFSQEFHENFLKKGYPSDFSLDLYAMYQARAHDYALQTIPVYYAKRLYGEAKGGWKSRIRLIRRTLRYIFRTKKINGV